MSVSHLVSMHLAGLGLRELVQQLLDDIEIAVEEGALVGLAVSSDVLFA